MKKLFPFLFMLLPVLALGQDLPIDESGKVNFNEVVQVEGASSLQLYTQARSWFASSFKSSKDVLEVDDKETGTLVGKAWQDIYVKALGMPVPIKMWYTVKVDLKDGRYRYQITNIQYEAYPGDYNRNPRPTNAELTIVDGLRDKKGKIKSIPGQYKEQTEASIKALAESLKKAMASKEVSKKEDW